MGAREIANISNFITVNVCELLVHKPLNRLNINLDSQRLSAGNLFELASLLEHALPS